MRQQTLLRVGGTIVVGVFATGIWATGAQPAWDWLDIYSYAISAGLVALWLWEIFLWRFSPFQRMRLTQRDVRGTWRGTLTPLGTVSDGESAPGPKVVYLVVRQTATTVRAILLTDEARSVSSLASMTSEDGTASLDYIYSGSPNLRHRHRSPIHNGSCSLAITGIPATRMRGSYWTDRNSCGELDFTERADSNAEDFDEAEALFAIGEGEI
jgi:hypothetical protein